jgi:hypothetical protein
VNPPLATTAVSVVPPQRAGMAAGVNNTFRQVGIATGIAALGAIFQSRILSSLSHADISTQVPLHPLAQAIASGATPRALPFERGPGGLRLNAPAIAHQAFINGLNTIFLVAAVILFVGAVLAFVLVRRKDFVASEAAVPAGAG